MTKINDEWEKFSKKFLRVTQQFGRTDLSWNLPLDYQTLHDDLNNLQFQVEKTVETIRRTIRQTKPIFISIDELKSYSQRLNVARELIDHLERLMVKTVDSYVYLVKSYWSAAMTIDSVEQQKSLTNIFDLSTKEWRVLLIRIDKFLDGRKSSN